MLVNLRLQNFRCFSDHIVPFKQCTIIVGQNNAGKSTLVDALRLVSIVTIRYRTLGFRQVPAWGNLPAREVGVNPSIEGLDFNTHNLFHRYSEPPATVTAMFSNGNSAKIYIGPEGRLHVVLIAADGAIVRTRAMVSEGFLPRVEIMPHVAPVQRIETVLDRDYVRRNLSSSLASVHFRNQLNLMYDRFSRFQELAEQTWNGLRVEELIGEGGERGSDLRLLIRNDDYVSELSTMGHGLQMWLQAMWFLSRIEGNSSVALDEPDVYMHPDLQRRLIRYLRHAYPQVIVTTHSVEIMSETDADDMLVIDRSQDESRFATSMPAAQRVLEQLGSAQNLQLAKLWHARRCLLVEGKDFRYLSDLYDVLYPDDREGLAAFPCMSIGGWGGWQYAVGSAMLLQNSGGEHIAVYCILDSDYHTRHQMTVRREQASRNQINLHIWTKKEIENYLLIPSAIQRLIAARIARRIVAPTETEIAEKIDQLARDRYDEVFDGISAEILGENRGLGAAGANKETRSRLDSEWATAAGRQSLASGKSILTDLFRWAQEEFGVSMTSAAIIRAMYPFEVNEEIRGFLDTVVHGRTM
ncbi:MAG TPA: AAA family ATPase [Plasticicumulans sp.]|uniref:ATP-dependent nuclease n=1 Tax=Plasticicumulans sp. TaxID=2307179 RepID=UPI002C38F156|nr:AAA family ATPase [Plasticicumulans sp.]HMW28892.1 AAA family ATPase [Plasticicumulans sp.]HMW41029.1 AAA family ATPase [Plasticicumulans sp.]